MLKKIRSSLFTNDNEYKAVSAEKESEPEKGEGDAAVPDTTEWSNTLLSVKEQLCRLNETSEEEFLATGKRLHSFATSAKQIYTLSNESVEILSGK